MVDMNASPPHEQRERWMAAISESFHQVTVWRAARDRQADMHELRTSLEVGIQKMTRMLDDLWASPQLIAFWKRFLELVNRLYCGYREMMDWLEEGNWQKTQHCHAQEVVIKKLAVFDHYTTSFKQMYEDNFDTVGHHLGVHPTLYSRYKPIRRWSAGDKGLIDYKTVVKRRMKYERPLCNYVRNLEQHMYEVFRVTPGHYDSGVLFRRYVQEVQNSNIRQKRQYELQNKRYTYPDCRLTLSDNKMSSFRHRYAPYEEVPSWKEDKDLKRIFS